MKTTTLIRVSAVLLLVWAFVPGPGIGAQMTDRPSARGGGPEPNRWSAEAKQEPRIGGRHNAWLQGDERQQEQLMGCYRLSSDLERHALGMQKLLPSSPVDWRVFRNQYADMKRGALLLMQEHEEFASGLNNGQTSWWKTRLQRIMVVEFKLQARMGAIEGELKDGMPAPVKIGMLLMDLWEQFRVWNDCYAQIGADMDIENLNQKTSGAVRGLSGAQAP